MNFPVTLEQVSNLAAQLSPPDKLRLVEKIVRDLSASKEANQNPPRRSWMEIRGKATYPMCGEDAQAWVSSNRRESDDHREKQPERSP